MKNELLVALCLFLLGFSAILTDSRFQVSAASQALIPFTGTSCKPFVTKGLGLDLPKINYCFNQTKMSYADSRDNFTMNIPALSGVALTVTTSQNSSTVDYHLTGTVLAHAVAIDIFWITQKYNSLVILKGTIAGLSGTLPLTFLVVGGTKIGFQTGSTAITNGHLAFDWSAHPTLASFNNATKALTFNLGASFNIDPLAVDNNVQKNCGAGVSPCTSASVIMGLNSILIMGCQSYLSSDTLSASSSPSLTWTLRKTVSQTGLTSDEFYAISSSSQSYTFSCSSSSSTTLRLRVWGITGADTATIFDSHASVPCTTATTIPANIATVVSCTLSTNNVNTFIYGMFFSASNPSTAEPNSGWTRIGICCQPPNTEYQIFSSAQTNLVVSMSLTIVAGGAVNEIADAVFATQNTVTTTTTTSTTTTSTVSVSTQFPWFILAPVFIGLLLVFLGGKRLGR